MDQHSDQNISILYVGLQYSPRMGIFFSVKRPNYISLLSPTAGYPPPLPAHHRPSPSAAEPPSIATGLPLSTSLHRRTTVGCLPLPLAATFHRQMSPFAKGIFGNVQNSLGNSICLSNTLKNTCLGKLFPMIAFPKILFPGMKIQTSYQTSPSSFQPMRV